MLRRPRAQDAGYLYHVLNRGVGRMTLFEDDGNYAALERVLEETVGRGLGVELLAYTLMPNHWHLVLRPTRDGALSGFMRLLTVTHTQRWHATAAPRAPSRSTRGGTSRSLSRTTGTSHLLDYPP